MSNFDAVIVDSISKQIVYPETLTNINNVASELKVTDMYLNAKGSLVVGAKVEDSNEPVGCRGWYIDKVGELAADGSTITLHLTSQYPSGNYPGFTDTFTTESTKVNGLSELKTYLSNHSEGVYMSAGLVKYRVANKTITNTTNLFRGLKLENVDTDKNTITVSLASAIYPDYKATNTVDCVSACFYAYTQTTKTFETADKLNSDDYSIVLAQGTAVDSKTLNSTTIKTVPSDNIGACWINAYQIYNGRDGYVRGNCSNANGKGNRVFANDTVVYGSNNVIDGDDNAVYGMYNNIISRYNQTLGSGNTVMAAYNSVVIGYDNFIDCTKKIGTETNYILAGTGLKLTSYSNKHGGIITGSYTTPLTSTNSQHYSFVVGCGRDNTHRKNAIECYSNTSHKATLKFDSDYFLMPIFDEEGIKKGTFAKVSVIESNSGALSFRVEKA